MSSRVIAGLMDAGPRDEAVGKAQIQSLACDEVVMRTNGIIRRGPAS